jgi:hypothetical protein
MMKNTVCAVVLFVGLNWFATLPISSRSTADGGSITGTGEAVFSSKTSVYSIDVDRMEFATGIFVESEGSADGVFHGVLHGTTIIGQARDIVIEGNVIQGTPRENGISSFTGSAKVDLGNGIEIPNVPFTAMASEESISLVLQGTTLPTAPIRSGSLTIQ